MSYWFYKPSFRRYALDFESVVVVSWEVPSSESVLLRHGELLAVARGEDWSVRQALDLPPARELATVACEPCRIVGYVRSRIAGHARTPGCATVQCPECELMMWYEHA